MHNYSDYLTFHIETFKIFIVVLFVLDTEWKVKQENEERYTEK